MMWLVVDDCEAWGLGASKVEAKLKLKSTSMGSLWRWEVGLGYQWSQHQATNNFATFIACSVLFTAFSHSHPHTYPLWPPHVASMSLACSVPSLQSCTRSLWSWCGIESVCYRWVTLNRMFLPWSLQACCMLSQTSSIQHSSRAIVSLLFPYSMYL